jgi:hypothetical protein
MEGIEFNSESFKNIYKKIDNEERYITDYIYTET